VKIRNQPGELVTLALQPTVLPGCTQDLNAGRVEVRPQCLELVERASDCAAHPFVVVHG
jgi:hypothetical protein